MTGSSRSPVPWSAFGAVAVVGIAAAAWAGRAAFLFNDDFVFLGQAEHARFGRAYLTEGLFDHFSPVSRLVDAVAVGPLAAHVWLLRPALLGLFAGYVVAVVVLAVVLFGRTRLGLAVAAVLATSLAALPLATWWTAAVNILPALAGSALCLAGAVQVGRGRSAWWGVLALVAYVVAVLDYETPILVPGYALLWVLLFGTAETGAPTRVLLRRSAWVWVGLAAVGALSLLNYRLSYYRASESGTPGQYAEAMVRSLVQHQLPLVLGFADPGWRLFAWAGTALALAALGVLVVRGGRSPAVLQGLAFALLGWALPTAALVLNRVGVSGLEPVRLPYYYALSTVLVVIGLARTVAGRDGGSPPWLPRPAPLVSWSLVAVVVLAWAHSVDPSARSVLSAGHRLFGDVPPASDRFVVALRSSAGELARRDPTATVLDSDVPPALVWAEFAPYNRLDRVARLSGIDLSVDLADRPAYVATPQGRLVPVDLAWRSELAVRDGHEPGLQMGAADLTRTGAGACFSTTSGSAVEWILPEPVRGDRLVVRSEVSVDRPTPYRLYTAERSGPYAPANGDDKAWDPTGTAWLDTVSAHRVDKLVLTGLTPGVRVCLGALAVGQAVSR